MKAEEFDATLKKSRRDLRILAERVLAAEHATHVSKAIGWAMVDEDDWDSIVILARQALKDLGVEA